MVNVAQWLAALSSGQYAQAFAENAKRLLIQAISQLPEARRLLGDLFRYRDLGQLHLKGFHEPVETWAVEGWSQLESRFEAAHASRMSNFVGRE